jgi:hypothetical protein
MFNNKLCWNKIICTNNGVFSVLLLALVGRETRMYGVCNHPKQPGDRLCSPFSEYL